MKQKRFTSLDLIEHSSRVFRGVDAIGLDRGEFTMPSVGPFVDHRHKGIGSRGRVFHSGDQFLTCRSHIHSDPSDRRSIDASALSRGTRETSRVGFAREQASISHDFESEFTSNLHSMASSEPFTLSNVRDARTSEHFPMNPMAGTLFGILAREVCCAPSISCDIESNVRQVPHSITAPLQLFSRLKLEIWYPENVNC
jgi:hypothetical protein